MRKQLLCDIDGVLLPADPDPELPYMKRLVYLRKLCEEYRKSQGLKQIDDSLITHDRFNKRETTDLGYAMTLLYPDHNPFAQPLSCLLDIADIAESLIKDSMIYYFKLLKESNELVYEPNPGIREFLSQCQKAGWILKIASGNPYDLTESKLRLSGLENYFKNGDHPFLDLKMSYGEEAFFRDSIIISARNRLFDGKTLYIGDRVSDIGVVSRVEGVRGIIIPSFPAEQLYSTQIQDLVFTNRILVLDGLSDKKLRNQALSFMESNNQDIETKLPISAKR